MRQSASSRGRQSRALLRRLDRSAGNMNAFLLSLAIGLAVLDATIFTALKLSSLPVATIGSNPLVLQSGRTGSTP